MSKAMLQNGDKAIICNCSLYKEAYKLINYKCIIVNTGTLFTNVKLCDGTIKPVFTVDLKHDYVVGQQLLFSFMENGQW